jgi:regulator of sigma E protease
MDTILNIIIAILAFCFVVFFHELCHYLMARALKIKAKEFAVGFGKSLIVYQKKKFYFLPPKENKPYDLEEISFHLKVLPLGGYVKFDRPKMVDGKLDPGDNFINVHPFKRILVLLAGPLGNIALGLMLFFIFFNQHMPIGPHNEIQKIVENSYAEEIGLQKGDIIIGINGLKEFKLSDVKKGLKQDEFCISYERNGSPKEFCEVQKETKKLLGITMGSTAGIFVWEGTKLYGDLLTSYAESFLKIIFHLDIKSMSGPVGIIDAVQESVPVFNEFLIMMISINVALGVANLLFPLSITDGGRIIADLICLIRRKNQISTKYLDIISTLLIVLLFITTTFLDLQRLFEKIGWFG